MSTSAEGILNGYNAFSALFQGNTSKVLATPAQIAQLNPHHPGLFTVEDSLAFDNSQFLYEGTTFITLELPSLTEIAWETTKATNLTSDFEFACLYELESLYNLQNTLQIEVQKAADALQVRDLPQLMQILNFIIQLSGHLSEDYANAEENLKSCK